LKGKARKWFGWTVIVMSNLAFASVTIFSMKRLFVTEAEQQNIVNWTMLLTDIGLATVLVVLAIFMVWRLLDLIRAKGWWTQEYKAEIKRNAEAEIQEQKRKLKELEETLKEVEK
jgi:large-conductance mechanosensitive channel